MPPFLFRSFLSLVLLWNTRGTSHSGVPYEEIQEIVPVILETREVDKSIKSTIVPLDTKVHF